jgi:predicted O-methyltransferase YrrM
MNNKIFTSDWFSSNIPYWRAHIDSTKPMDILELGVFEGRSVVWMLENLNVKSLVAVDMWHKEWLESKGHFDTEANFDYNVQDYKNVKKWIASTHSFLTNNTKEFDLIYIDGAHDGKSVLTDAVLSHYALKPGGYLIFDDYSQTTNPNRIDRPRGAIDAFLKQFSLDYKILYKGYQIIAQKLTE